MPSVDEQLLVLEPGWGEAYSALINEARMDRRRKKEAEAEEFNNYENEDDLGADQGPNLRQQVAASMDDQTSDQAQAEQAQKEKQSGSGSMTGASKWLLKAAWLNLIPSFGLTLIWINLHCFGRIAFPTFFCKLGDEWVPTKAAKVAGQADVPGAFIVEAMILALLNLIAFGMIFLIVAIIYWFTTTWFGKLIGYIVS